MILIDTCVIVWEALEPAHLTKMAAATLKKNSGVGQTAICEISFWEIAMLVSKGRLNPGTDYRTFIELVLKANSYRILGITPEIADLSVNLPVINADPADRIIAATAITHGAPLVTADKNLRKADKVLRTIWD